MSDETQRDDEIPEIWSRIIDAIVDGETAWSSPDELVSAIGVDANDVLDQLAEMDIGGLVNLWERPEGIVFTLSVHSAARFGFVLIELGRFQELRWARLGDPEPETPPGGRGIRSNAMTRARLILDSHPGPDTDAELSESAAQYLRNGRFGTFRRGAGRGEPPRPTLLIGGSRPSWNESAKGSDEPCSSCNDRPFPAHAYCLDCDRWGLDAPNAPSFRTNRSARIPNGESPRDDRSRPAPSDRDQGRQAPQERRGSNPVRFHRYRHERLLERDRRRGI